MINQNSAYNFLDITTLYIKGSPYSGVSQLHDLLAATQCSSWQSVNAPQFPLNNELGFSTCTHLRSGRCPSHTMTMCWNQIL